MGRGRSELSCHLASARHAEGKASERSKPGSIQRSREAYLRFSPRNEKTVVRSSSRVWKMADIIDFPDAWISDRWASVQSGDRRASVSRSDALVCSRNDLRAWIWLRCVVEFQLCFRSVRKLGTTRHAVRPIEMAKRCHQSWRNENDETAFHCVWSSFRGDAFWWCPACPLRLEVGTTIEAEFSPVAGQPLVLAWLGTVPATYIRCCFEETDYGAG